MLGQRPALTTLRRAAVPGPSWHAAPHSPARKCHAVALWQPREALAAPVSGWLVGHLVQV